MTKALLLLCAVLGASLPSMAQNIVYHDDSNPTTGGANAFPFGAEGVRIQQLIPNSALGTTPAFIRDLYVNPVIAASVPNITTSQCYYGDFEIRMGLTQLTTLTNTWATNSPNPTTVFRGPLVVLFEKDQWVPLGLPDSYLWLPMSPADNLVIDFICWDVIERGAVPPNPNNYFMDLHRSPTDSISRAYRLGWVSIQQTTSFGVDGGGIKLGFLLNDGNFVVHEGACAGSSGLVPQIGATPGTWPQVGQSFNVTLAQGAANSVATLVLGFDNVNYLGAPLPVDMGLVGAAGCRFWHSWELLLPLIGTDGTGAATYTLQFPVSVSPPAQLFGTWLGLDLPANSFGLVPSGFLTMNL